MFPLKRNSLTAALCVLHLSFSFAQTASQNSVTETCACVKKIEPTLSEEKKTGQAFTCMIASLGKYMPQLKKEYYIKIEDDRQAGMAVGKKISGKLYQECPEMAAYLMKMAVTSQANASVKQADISTDTLKLDTKVCAIFKSGKYKSDKMYMNKKAIENPDATSYTEVKDGFINDYSDNKKIISKWTQRWINPCEWEQTLVESNDANINAIIKKGDKIAVKAIGSTQAGGLYLSSAMMGIDFILLVSKIK